MEIDSQLSLDKIIQEALHSNQYGTLTGAELKAILDVVNHAKSDLDSNEGNRGDKAWEEDVEVTFK